MMHEVPFEAEVMISRPLCYALMKWNKCHKGNVDLQSVFSFTLLRQRVLYAHKETAILFDTAASLELWPLRLE